MIYRNQIIRGLSYLRGSQNRDKGIPATKHGDASGCWTTASALESLLSAPYNAIDPRPFALELIGFLESSQLKTAEHHGGWPLVIGSERASTMATGHAVAALMKSRHYLADDSELVVRVDRLTSIGLQWLESNRDLYGGWGVEPKGGPSGQSPRMISTVYALRAYFEHSRNVDNSQTVRLAVEYVRGLNNPDGGFAGRVGEPSDVCSTARAITALLRSGFYKPKDKAIRRALRFISQSKPKRQLWPLDTETYVTEGAPGQTVYNSNTTADVLEAFLRAGEFAQSTGSLHKVVYEYPTR